MAPWGLKEIVRERVRERAEAGEGGALTELQAALMAKSTQPLTPSS
jgi:hypothetical protein